MNDDYDLDILFDIEHLDDIYDTYKEIKEYDVDSYSYYFDKIEFKNFQINWRIIKIFMINKIKIIIDWIIYQEKTYMIKKNKLKNYNK